MTTFPRRVHDKFLSAGEEEVLRHFCITHFFNPRQAEYSTSKEGVMYAYDWIPRQLRLNRP